MGPLTLGASKTGDGSDRNISSWLGVVSLHCYSVFKTPYGGGEKNKVNSCIVGFFTLFTSIKHYANSIETQVGPRSRLERTGEVAALE